MTSATRTRVEPTAFRCSALSRSARRSAIPAPTIARVAIMNANSGRLSWISFTMVQIVEFSGTSNGRIAAPRSPEFVPVMSVTHYLHFVRAAASRKVSVCSP